MKLIDQIKWFFNQQKYIKVKIVTIKGKKYIFNKIDEFQCAYCLYLQEPTTNRPIRDKDGMVIGIPIFKEEHRDDCKQK